MPSEWEQLQVILLRVKTLEELSAILARILPFHLEELQNSVNAMAERFRIYRDVSSSERRN